MIKQHGKEFLVMDSTGSKVLGRKSSEIEAHKLERKLNVNKMLKDTPDKQQGRV